MIFAIEGIDASGKATQSKLLAERLLSQGFAVRGSVKQLAFPAYNTVTGKVIRNLLSGVVCVREAEVADTTGNDFEHTPRFEQALVLQSLMAVNRFEHYSVLLRASGSLDHHLVLDRYRLSGLVYGVADGLDVDWLRAIHSGLPRADRTIYLDIPIEESFRRRPKRDDRYEADRERLERARTGYLTCCETEMAVRVDGLGSLDDVADRIWRQRNA
jgi:dTMP kinase